MPFSEPTQPVQYLLTYWIYEWTPTALCSATTRKIVATKALTWLNKEHTFTYIQGFQNTMHVFFNVAQCSSMTIFCSLNWFWKLNKYIVLLRSTLISNVTWHFHSFWNFIDAGLHRWKFSFRIIYAKSRKSTLTNE